MPLEVLRDWDRRQRPHTVPSIGAVVPIWASVVRERVLYSRLPLTGLRAGARSPCNGASAASALAQHDQSPAGSSNRSASLGAGTARELHAGVEDLRPPPRQALERRRASRHDEDERRQRALDNRTFPRRPFSIG